MTPPSPRLLLSVFSTFSVGGPQVRFAAIANHFGRRFRHVIVAMDGAFDCRDRLNPELDVTLHPIGKGKGNTLGNRRRFRDALRSIHPDCLVTYNWGAIEWAMANWPHLVPHVHIEDGFGPEESDRQLRRRAIARRFVLRGSTVVVPSQNLVHIATDIWKLRRSTLQYIPNGIDCARFANSHIEPYLPRNGRPIIGTVAALRAEKNLLRMIDAFRLIQAEVPCRLVIAGDGPERTRLEAHVGELGLSASVVFTGYRQDTERIYAGLDVFVLSSDTEQMPTTVIEAMAAGLPIAATDVGDVGRMVATENRPYVVPANSNSLARAILALLKEVNLREQIGAANKNRAKREFSMERMVATYGEVFDAAMEGNS